MIISTIMFFVFFFQKPALKPSQINPVTAPKPSKMSPILAPQNNSNPSSSNSSKIHPQKKKKVIRTVASKPKNQSTTRVMVGALNRKKKTSSPLLQRKPPAGAVDVKVRLSLRSPIKAPSERSVTTTCGSSSNSSLQGGNDFIFPTHAQCGNTADSRLHVTSSRCTEGSRHYSSNSDNIIHASALSHKVKGSDTNLFKDASSTMTDKNYSCVVTESVVAPFGPAAQRVSFNDSPSPTTLTSNPFQSLPESTVNISPRKVMYSESTASPDALATQEEQMRKSTVIKLNKAKGITCHSCIHVPLTGNLCK